MPPWGPLGSGSKMPDLYDLSDIPSPGRTPTASADPYDLSDVPSVALQDRPMDLMGAVGSGLQDIGRVGLTPFAGGEQLSRMALEGMGLTVPDDSVPFSNTLRDMSQTEASNQQSAQQGYAAPSLGTRVLEGATRSAVGMVPGLAVAPAAAAAELGPLAINAAAAIPGGISTAGNQLGEDLNDPEMTTFQRLARMALQGGTEVVGELAHIPKLGRGAEEALAKAMAGRGGNANALDLLTHPLGQSGQEAFTGGAQSIANDLTGTRDVSAGNVVGNAFDSAGISALTALPAGAVMAGGAHAMNRRADQREAQAHDQQLAGMALAGLDPANAQQQVIPDQQAPGGDLTQPIEQPSTPPLSITPEVIDAALQHPDLLKLFGITGMADPQTRQTEIRRKQVEDVNPQQQLADQEQEAADLARSLDRQEQDAADQKRSALLAEADAAEKKARADLDFREETLRMVNSVRGPDDQMKREHMGLPPEPRQEIPAPLTIGQPATQAPTNPRPLPEPTPVEQARRAAQERAAQLQQEEGTADVTAQSSNPPSVETRVEPTSTGRVAQPPGVRAAVPPVRAPDQTGQAAVTPAAAQPFTGGTAPAPSSNTSRPSSVPVRSIADLDRGFREVYGLKPDESAAATAIVRARAAAMGEDADAFAARTIAEIRKGSGRRTDNDAALLQEGTRIIPRDESLEFDKLRRHWQKAHGERAKPGTESWRQLQKRAAVIDRRNGVLYQEDVGTLNDAPRSADTGKRVKKGAINFEDYAADGRAVIHALEAPDVSTAVHELGHMMRRTLSPVEQAVAGRWAGAKDGTWSRSAEEKFARGFERYLRDGTAPHAALRKIFGKLRDWLHNVYQSIKGSPIDIPITPEIRSLFDRMLTPKDAAQAAALERGMATDEQRAANVPSNVPSPGAKGTIEGTTDDAVNARIAATFGNFDQALTDYAKLKDADGGRILNVDTARELSSDYAASKENRTKYSVATHEPASAFIKQAYTHQLEHAKPGSVMFLAGGGGSGKSTVLNGPAASLRDQSAIIMDAVMGNYDKAVTNVEKALKSGRPVSIAYVHTPFPLAAARALKRMGNSGRRVPLHVLAEAHAGAQDTILKLAQRYAGNPLVEIRAYDNSTQVKPMSIAEITAQRYTPADGNQSDTIAKLQASIPSAVREGFGDGDRLGTVGSERGPGSVQSEAPTGDAGSDHSSGPSRVSASESVTPQSLTSEPKPTRETPLAIPATDDAQRQAIGELDKQRDQPEPSKQDNVHAQAQRAVENDHPGERKRVLALANNGELLSDYDTAVAQELLRRDTQAAIDSGKPEELQNLATMHAAYRDSGTEQARALAIRRDPSESPNRRRGRMVTDSILTPPKPLRDLMQKARERIRKATEANDTAGAAAARKSLDRLSERAQQRLLRVRAFFAKEGIDLLYQGDNVQHIAAMVNAASKANNTYNGIMREYWLNAVLSGPRSVVVNAAAVNAVWNLGVNRFAEAAWNSLTGERNPDAATLKEYRLMWKGMIGNGALRNALQSFQSERPIFGEDIEGSTQFDHYGPQIQGRLGRIVRFPTRLLLAADQFNKTWSGSVEVTAQAYRLAKKQLGKDASDDALQQRMHDLIEDKESPAWDHAKKVATELAFQNELPGALKSILKIRDAKVPGTDLRPLFYVMPFVKTPANIIGEGIKASPLGLARMLWKVGQDKLGGQTYERSAFAKDAAQQMIGTFVSLAVMGMAGYEDKDGLPLMTGSEGSFSPGKAGIQDQTMKPYTIRIPGTNTTLDYQRIEPFATWFSLVADGTRAAKRAGKGQSAPDTMRQLVKAVTSQVLDKSMMKSLSDVFQMFTGDKDPTTWSRNFASSWIPNVIRAPLRDADNTPRETGVWGTGADFWKLYFKRIGQTVAPWTQHPRINLLGDEINKSDAGPLTDIGARMTRLASPSVVGAKPDAPDLYRWLTRYNNDPTHPPYFPSNPSKEYRVKGERGYLTEAQYEQVQRRAGALLKEKLARVSDELDLRTEHPTTGEQKRIQKMIASARRAARSEVVKDSQGDDEEQP